MTRKKRSSLFNEEDKTQQCIKYLKEVGYGVFKAESPSTVEEEEAVKKLRAVGYRVEHIRDSVVKVDSARISSPDDIAVYFHEMMKRHSPKRHNPKRLTDKNLRLVDHSVINSFISWRVDEGSSLVDALNDMFIMINVLFDRAKEENIDIRGMGVLSVNTNKPFVLYLLNEVKLRKDAKLQVEIDSLISREDKSMYLDLLNSAREAMDSVEDKSPTKKIIRKIKVDN
jgi:hypothetical protein